MKRVYTLVILLLPLFLAAQSLKVEKHHKAKYFEPAMELDRDAFVHYYFNELGLSSPDDLGKARVFESKNGWVRNRYKQSYRGLAVLGSSFVIHEQDGIVKKSTGALYPNIAIDINPKQSVGSIVSMLENHIMNSSPESTDDLIAIRDDLKIESTDLRIMDKAYPKFSGAYTLVYEIVVVRSIPKYDRISFYMDANTGQFLHEQSHMCSISVEGEANTRYYGIKKIVTDSIAPNRFQLYDETRNVRTMNGQERGWYPSRDNYVDFEDSDNFWDNSNEKLDEVAGDVHYCSSAYHDFMLNNFDWEGKDGLGTDSSDLTAIVHINDKFYLNAFWDGKYTYYGNGLCADYGPLTTLDVVGHEFAHAFTQFSSGLIYQDESGALNEGTSDIFGKALEYAYDPDNFNWLIGDRFTSGEGEAFRNMSDPNEKGHPKYYKGMYWSDFGAVHTNSGVYNFWFYLLVEGGTGINEAGYSYNVPSIGWEDATDIAYGAQVGFYTPSTGYHEAYKYTLEFIIDTYGANSAQYAAVEEAWNAVGITSGASGPAIGGSIQVDGIATTICNDECLEIKMELVNLGNNSIPAQTSINLRYLLDNDVMANETLVLAQDLAIGDTLSFTFDRLVCWFDISGSQDYLEVEISTDGGNEYVRSDYNFINLNTGESFDVELTRFDLSNNVCNSELFSLQYRFENESCEVIDSGTVYELILNVNGNQQIETRTLTRDVRPSVGQIFITSFYFDVPLQFINDYTVELAFPNDPDLSNNTLNGSFRTFEILKEGNVENYSDYNQNESKWVYTNNPYYSFAVGFEHQSSERLVVGGTSQHSDWNEPTKCTKAEDFFYSVPFVYRSSLDICYDTENMDDPVLRFDYIPYYSSEVAGLSPEFTALHEVSISSLQESLPLQYGFPEGVEQSLTYTVPQGSGEINISILSMYGNEFEVLNGDFSNGDYQFFDNIRIEERGTVSTEEEDINREISVFPNPASEEIHFVDTKNREFNLRVFSIDGRKVLTTNAINSEFVWHVDQSLSGLYLYEMQFENGQTAQGKFILEN